MLAGFAEGLYTEGAREDAAGSPRRISRRAIARFLRNTSRSSPATVPAKTLTFKALKEAVDKNPEDADLAAQLADRYYSTGDKKRARELADKALTLKTRPSARRLRQGDAAQRQR